MLILFMLLNVFLSVINCYIGLSDNSLFNIWVSGFSAASAFCLFMLWITNK